MSLSCSSCKKEYVLTQKSAEIAERFKVPQPTACNDCRMQRRLAFRNDRFFSLRACDKCREPVVTVFPQTSKHRVYCAKCWWSDTWDPLAFGREMDFNRPFFEQYKELFEAVPLLANMVVNSTNCDYNNGCVNSKDCYLSARLGDSEKIMYTYLALRSLGCMDCFDIYDSQYCYECIDCQNCYGALFAESCKNCNDIAFCEDCIGCKNCFGSAGLRNKEYYFFNERCTKEEYEEKKNAYLNGTENCLKKAKEDYASHRLLHPFRHLHILNAQEEATGDFIFDAKDVHESYDILKSESVANSWGVEMSKDIYDSAFIYFGENQYENIGSSRGTNIQFGFSVFDSSDMMYCISCFQNSKDCFGSAGLKKGRYAILNKMYDEKDYHEKKNRIIEHMKRTGEFGKFFDPHISSVGYNHSLAQDYFPRAKDEAIREEFNWEEENPKEYQKGTCEIPQSIQEVADTITKEIFACKTCGKNYKITAQELELYRQFHLPVPAICFNCRHAKRLQKRNPHKLFRRNCAKCGTPTQTSYPPTAPEKIHCEKCYQEEIY